MFACILRIRVPEKTKGSDERKYFSISLGSLCWWGILTDIMPVLIPRLACFTLWYLAVDLEMLWTLAGLHHGRLQMVFGHWSKLLVPSSDSHGQKRSLQPRSQCTVYIRRCMKMWGYENVETCNVFSLNKNTFQVCHCCLPSDQVAVTMSLL